ncbi:hypothetical protein RB2150_02499 [Rhodobacteraceae bacterium HTCC2150]|nr:hypothetical protein RB2150_02499 [Rhodobacteraceae bacterium HTCC2150]
MGVVFRGLSIICKNKSLNQTKCIESQMNLLSKIGAIQMI